MAATDYVPRGAVHGPIPSTRLPDDPPQGSPSMVTQGMRNRRTLAVRPDMTGPGGAGAVNPAGMQIDLYLRSPESDDANHPSRAVCDHFFAMEVVWR